MAMEKIIAPSGWSWDVPVAAIVKLSRDNTLGPNDRRDLVKRAGYAGMDLFSSQMDRLKFAKDEIPVHVIALGASEAWGPNRNGDAFTESTLKQAHDTFTKYAFWFRNHKNKKEKGNPHYGTVKASAYNPEMRRVELLVGLPATKAAADVLGCNGPADKEVEKLARGEDIPVSMACPKVGTLVKLLRGWKKVEEIRPGDYVLTHRGRYRRVYARIRRTKQTYAKISVKYAGRQVLEFTPEHEFFVARWRDIPTPKNRNGLRSNDLTGFSRAFRKKYRNQLHAHARWLSCGELTPGDLLLMPIDRGTGTSSLTGEVARLMGYYTAEGSVTSDGYLCFTCNKADAAVDEIPQLARVSCGIVEHSASAQAINLSVYSKPLTSQIALSVGRGVRNKTIPSEVVNATSDVKLEYAAAWFNGDGWQDVKGLHWSTCSRTLSIELQMLLASIGIPASVYRIDHTSDLPHNTPRLGDGIEYTVNVSNRYSGLFVGRSKAEVVEMRAEKTTVFITGDYLAFPVKSVDLIEAEIDVCDLSVEEDESFTAYGFAVHNCRVPYDICSGCGNKARTREEYCKEANCKYGGCYDNLTRLIKTAKDVHLLHVRNDHPIFFDISNVFRPADRTAYGGRADWVKAANDGFFGIGGAAMAEDLGLQSPFAVIVAQDSTALQNPALAEHIKIAHGLAALEQQPDLWNSPDVRFAFSRSIQPDFDLDALELTSDRREKIASGLTALADRKIILPLRDFARMIKKSEFVELAGTRLAGVYHRMIADGTLEKNLSQQVFETEKLASIKQRDAAGRMASTYSLEKTAVDTRCAQAVIRGHKATNLKSTFWNEKSAQDRDAAEALARDYACYKVAALRRITNFDDEFMLTARLSACQNQVI